MTGSETAPARARGALAIALLAVAVGCLALAVRPAGAAAPVKGGFYDGNDGLVLQVNVAGTRVVRTFLDVRTVCNGRRATSSTSVPRGLRIRNGKFSFSDSRYFPDTKGTQAQKGTGRFLAGGKVVLTYRQTINNPATNTRCDTGVQKLVARADGISRFQTGLYSGSSTQGQAVRLQVIESGDGLVDNFRSRIEMKCDKGPNRSDQVLFGGLSLRAGQFADKGRSDDADGYVIKEIQGRLSGTRVSGTLRATGRFLIGYTGEFDGIPVRTDCDSGPVRFTAKK